MNKTDRLAELIRSVDGSHVLGAGALAEALIATGALHIDGEPVPAAPTLPNEPGPYLAEGGDLLFLTGGPNGRWWAAGLADPVDPAEYAPFTRLVPEGENRAAIASEVLNRDAVAVALMSIYDHGTKPNAYLEADALIQALTEQGS